MCEQPKSPADQRFQRKCQAAAGVSLVLYLVCSQTALRLHLGTAADAALAAVAGAAFFAELVSVGLLTLRLRDEFQRILLTRSFVWATLVTMALATVWGSVELHSRGSLPHLSVLWLPITLVCATAIAKLLIFRQHSAQGE